MEAKINDVTAHNANFPLDNKRPHTRTAPKGLKERSANRRGQLAPPSTALPHHFVRPSLPPPPLSQRQFNPLQDDIADFAVLPKGGLPQALINGLGQINAAVHDPGPGLAAYGRDYTYDLIITEANCWRPVRTHQYGCNSNWPIPAAISSPTCPCTDTGCSAMVLFDPPTKTLAPRPAATDTSADAPV